MKEEIKRLFFGVEVHAPWPSEFPPGRLLDKTHRHLTLAFLGNIPYLPLLNLLENFPNPSGFLGSVAHFDSCLSLPERHPHVVAWHVHWDEDSPIIEFQKILVNWLLSHHYSLDTREWNPHVTLCRQPFDLPAWKKSFKPLPFYIGSIHLYESLGNSNYISLWKYPVKPPFEEIEHTADMAFIIRGTSLQQLYLHAFTSLAFKASEFLDFFKSPDSLNTLDDLIIALNAIIANVDGSVGCPMKAVSFHGDIVVNDSLLEWEMIVDV